MKKNSNFSDLKKKEKGHNKLNLKRINISDVQSFLDKIKKYKKQSSINFIKTVMRKYIRLLNDEPDLDYKEKIKFSNNNDCHDLSFRQQVVMIKYLKEKYDIQIILIYYFLYYLGFTYSSCSRLLISHFHKDYMRHLNRLKHYNDPTSNNHKSLKAQQSFCILDISRYSCKARSLQK